MEHTGDFLLDHPYVLNSFPCDISTCLHDLDYVFCSGDETNGLLLDTDAEPPIGNTPLNDNAARRLILGLGHFHDCVRDCILSAPEFEQAWLTNMLAMWALQVSRDPLGGTDLRSEDTEQGSTETYGTRVGQSAIV